MVRAAETARARNAFPEALESCQQAMGLLSTLSESSERDLRKLELGQSVVRMLSITKGHVAPETIEATERLAALADKSGNLKQLVNLLVARTHIAFMSGDYRTADNLGVQTLELAQREGSPTSLALAHDQLIGSRHMLGDLGAVEKHFTEWLRFCDDLGFKQKTIPGSTVVSFGFASWNAWMLGRFSLAREREARMMAAARANGNNPHDLAWSAYSAASLRTYLRESEQAEILAARALEVAEQNQFPQIAAFARCTLGLARAMVGHANEGIELIRDGIAGLLQAGTHAPAYLGSLGWAQLIAGDIDSAVATAEQALQAVADSPTNRRGALALRGELRLIQGHTELAEVDFREGLAIAGAMGAKALELSSTMGLARVLAKQGRHNEASTMLAEIYGSFTEGFDTADLKDAKVLLSELQR